MPPSEAPSSLALDDIMLIEDDDEGNNNNDLAKISDIQDQLQKQAEVIRDLLVQRDFLITQILQERERWQAERDGWDRTSEALIKRTRKKDDSVNEEDLTHRCALYESDNKALKEKLSNAQARLGDLEAELVKLKPLLVMQLSLLPRQASTRSTIPYPYPQAQSYVSPFGTTIPYTPFPTYNATPTPVSGSKGRKRKRDEYLVDSSANKGKKKGGTNSNVDGDSEAEAPPTPAATPASQNPYAYMNDLYRQTVSPLKVPNTPTPLQSLNTLGSATFAAASPGGFNHYGVTYPYPYPSSSFSKPSSSTTAPTFSTPSRSDDAEKEGSQGDSNAEAQELSSRHEKTNSSAAKSAPGSIRRPGTAGRRGQRHGKAKETTLSDARAEHLLLAARKLGWERATAIATLARTQGRLPPEETGKDKSRAPDTGRQIDVRTPTKRAGLQRNATVVIQSPSSPTPRRVHGSSDPILTSPSARLSSSKIKQSTSRTRGIALSSSQTLPSTPRVKTPRKLNTESHEDAASGQTPLDSLLSAARTMMSEDVGGNQTGTRQGIEVLDLPNADEETTRSLSQSRAEQESIDEGTPRRKRRRNPAGKSPVTPKPRATEKQRIRTSASGTGREWGAMPDLPQIGVSGVQAPNSTPSSARTKSALDVLADQAAAASDSGPTANLVSHQGGIEVPLRERTDEVAQTGGAGSPRTVNKSADQSRENTPGADQEASKGKEEVDSLLQTTSPGHDRDNIIPTIQVAGVGPTHSEPLHPSMMQLQEHTHGDGAMDSNPLQSRPNFGTTNTELGAESEGDMDAEGDIDPDSHETLFASPDI